MRKQVRLAIIGVVIAVAVFGAVAGGYIVARKTFLRPQPTIGAAGGVLPDAPSERVGNFALTITSQQDGTTISNPVTVSGGGSIAAGQTVIVRLRDDKGAEIATTTAPFSTGYSASLTYTLPAGISAGQLEVMALDPQTQVPVAGQALRVVFAKP